MSPNDTGEGKGQSRNYVTFLGHFLNEISPLKALEKSFDYCEMKNVTSHGWVGSKGQCHQMLHRGKRGYKIRQKV